MFVLVIPKIDLNLSDIKLKSCKQIVYHFVLANILDVYLRVLENVLEVLSRFFQAILYYLSSVLYEIVCQFTFLNTYYTVSTKNQLTEPMTSEEITECL